MGACCSRCPTTRALALQQLTEILFAQRQWAECIEHATIAVRAVDELLSWSYPISATLLLRVSSAAKQISRWDDVGRFGAEATARLAVSYGEDHPVVTRVRADSAQ